MDNTLICTPIMLPTKNVDTPLYMSMGHKIRSWAEADNIDYFCHLYLFSEQEIKEGDWYIHQNKISRSSNDSHTLWSMPIFKIIAATDKSLSLPLIPSSFIERWVKEQGKIDKVKIRTHFVGAMEDFKQLFILTNDNNEVIILPIEDKLYTREEVINNMKHFLRIHPKWSSNDLLEKIDNWFAKNYPI